MEFLVNTNKPKFSSVYRGVSKRKNKWDVRIGVAGKSCYMGTSDSELEAAISYNGFAIKLYGGEAKLNNIPLET